MVEEEFATITIDGESCLNILLQILHLSDSFMSWALCKRDLSISMRKKFYLNLSIVLFNIGYLLNNRIFI